MKSISTNLIGAVSTAVVLTLLSAAPLRSQDDQRRDNPPAQEEAKPAPKARPVDRQETKPPEGAKPGRQDAAKPPRQNEAKPAQQQQQKQSQNQTRHAQQDQQKQAQQQQKDQQKQAEQPRKDQEKQAKQQNRSDQDRHAQNESRPVPPAQRPGAQAQNSAPTRPGSGPRGGERIPDDKFRAHFGREHHFRINHPTIIEGRPRFQYSGYWFEFVDPWPASWSYDDDCYIDYVDDGYWLFDPRYPGMRIAVEVVF